MIISGQIRFREVFDGKHREVFGGKRRGGFIMGEEDFRSTLMKYRDSSMSIWQLSKELLSADPEFTEPSCKDLL